MGPKHTRPPLPALPPPALKLLQDYLAQRSLGASRNIRQINDLLCSIADAWPTESSAELVAGLQATGDYFIATRGRNTPAIGNAVRSVLHGIGGLSDGALSSVRAFIAERRDQYNAQSVRNVEAMAEYGANVLAHTEVIMPFDYSSTMMGILKRLADRGLPKRLIVLESRVLDGGRPIANEATSWGHSVDFTVDLAFGYFLPQVDAVLIGAETILANGDCWNTTGSHPIAAMSGLYGVPFYCATELIKIDPRSFSGVRAPIKLRESAQLLGYPDTFGHPEQVHITVPDLDNVPARLISAYITPGGVIPPEQVWTASREFLESIGVSPV